MLVAIHSAGAQSIILQSSINPIGCNYWCQLISIQRLVNMDTLIGDCNLQVVYACHVQRTTMHQNGVTHTGNGEVKGKQSSIEKEDAKPSLAQFIRLPII